MRLITSSSAGTVHACLESFHSPVFKISRRLRRPAPLVFAGAAVVCLVGGALHPSMNGDTLSYRLPRVLHWLGEARWHWIRALDDRMNSAGCGFEWLSAPIILFTRTDRAVFLINWISFLFLPGLIFAVFKVLGVAGRVAWWWMWILPCGWCYALQAGSCVTDAYIVIFALASIHFALRAAQKQKLSDAWLSMIAAGLLTGSKQSGIPLAFLWLIAFWPVRSLCLRRPFASAAVAVLSLAISALPLALLNLQRTGKWNGNVSGFELNSPVWAVIGNAFCLLAQNLLPGLFPWSNTWNASMRQFLTSPFGSHFRGFEEFGYLGRAANERTAGIGIAVLLLAVFSWWAARRGAINGAFPATVCPGSTRIKGVTNRWREKLTVPFLLRVAPVVPLLAFMAKDGAHENARHLAPYYVFFFPALLVTRGQPQLVRRKSWQGFALVAMLTVFVLFAMSHERPLLPIKALTSRLLPLHPESRLLRAVDQVFSVHSDLSVIRHPFTTEIPPGQSLVGYATLRGWAEPSLWLPFGKRRVQRVFPEDDRAWAERHGIRYVVLDDEEGFFAAKPLPGWLKDLDAELIKDVPYQMAPKAVPNHLYLLKLK